MSEPTTPQIGRHVHRISVRFGDCDPAGIVYFPRFFDFFHQAMETWFAEGLGIAYDEVINRRMVGFPAVHTEADFSAPSRFGELLEVELRVERLGRTSITFGYAIRREGETEARVTGKTVCAVYDLDPSSEHYRRAIAWPDDLRAAVLSFGPAS